MMNISSFIFIFYRFILFMALLSFHILYGTSSREQLRDTNVPGKGTERVAVNSKSEFLLADSRTG